MAKTVTVVAADVPPVAAFATTQSGLAVTVDGSTSTDSDGTITSYAWAFGDGGTASGMFPPAHSYAAGGIYTITLTVTDDRGATNSLSKTITVIAPNVPPVAAFTTAQTDLAVTVNGSTSTDSDGTITSYAWTFGDGGTATGATPAAHTYAAAGPYTITLTVTDNRGGTNSVTKGITVVAADVSPIAAFTTTQTDLSVSPDASTSVDPDGTITSYAWSFGDGGTATGVTPPAHTYAAAGLYTITLTVTDDRGAMNSVSKSVTVVAPNVPPVAAFTTSQSGLAVTVNGSTSSDSDGTIASYAWTFGDGGTATGATPAPHTYAAAGPYTITLTVTDNRGGTNSTTKDVTVSAPANVPPVAAFTTSQSGLAVTVNGSTSSDSDGTVASYAWTFGDGGTATGATPAAHTYAAAGPYTITLTVTDNKGATNSTTKSVTVTVATTLAQDAFTRTLASGSWGSADVGGAWSLSGGSAAFSVAGGKGLMRLAPADTRQATAGWCVGDGCCGAGRDLLRCGGYPRLVRRRRT